MKSKTFLGIILFSTLVILYSCGGKSTSDQQVEALQQQVAALQQQVEQNNNQQTQQSTNLQTQQPIQNFGTQQGFNVSLEQAKQTAVTHAGFTIDTVTFIKTVQDWDNGMAKWDIDFINGNNKYEYDISAYDGSILKSEIQAVAYNQGVYATQGGYVPQQGIVQQGGYVPQQGNVVGQGQGIDVESAKSIAATSAGFNAASVTFVKTKYDFDDGIAKWEIEFVVNTNKYEYDISAVNGTILKSKIESIYND